MPEIARKLATVVRPACGIGALLIAIGFLNTLLYQWPLFRFAVASRSGFAWHDALALVTLFVLQLVVTVTILGLVALVSTRLLKGLCIVFALGNAVALYFIVQYGVILDAAMSGNVLNTNVSEASELAHPRLLLYIVLLGIVPALVIAWVRIRPSSRLWRGAFALSVLVLGSAWTYANAQSWLWIDRNAKVFGGLVLPWSYVINPIRYYQKEIALHRPVELLPPLTRTDNERVVVVLVIGESARSQNFSLYGYARQTNPWLASAGVTIFPDARSCTTYTAGSLRCILSHREVAAHRSNDEPLPSYLHRHAIDVIWRTNNFGEPPMQVTTFERAGEIRSRCRTDCEHLEYDEVLVHGLADRLRDAPAGAKTLVILHQAGSHGPQYARKYPAGFGKFEPTCRTVELKQCSTQELLNAYDNTILYTDHVLHRVIEVLRSMEGVATAMLYMSDHGESLGEHGLYLHGVPMAIAPDEQTAVPLITWTSAAFRRLRGISPVATSGLRGASHDVVFHSVMGALGLTSAAYVPERDLFRAMRSDAAGSMGRASRARSSE